MKRSYILGNLIRAAIFVLLVLIVYGNWDRCTTEMRIVIIIFCVIVAALVIIVPEILFSGQRKRVNAEKEQNSVKSPEKTVDTDSIVMTGKSSDKEADTDQEKESLKAQARSGLRGQLVTKDASQPGHEPHRYEYTGAKKEIAVPIEAKKETTAPAVGKWTCGLCGTENNNTAVCECCGTPRE